MEFTYVAIAGIMGVVGFVTLVAIIETFIMDYEKRTGKTLMQIFRPWDEDL